MAVEGIRALKEAPARIMADPTEASARSQALYGSWLCGTVLGTVGMALHHKLCHTLGGSFDLPHAETHAIVLPHSAAYNAAAAADALQPAAPIFCGGSVGGGLYDFAAFLGAPLALRDLGLQEADLRSRGRSRGPESQLEPAADRAGGGARLAPACLGGHAARVTAQRPPGSRDAGGPPARTHQSAAPPRTAAVRGG